MLKSRIALMLLLFFCTGSLVTFGQAKPVITGVVKDSTGAPMAAVTVMVKGTSIGTTTDASGVFKVEASPANTLIFSAVGYGQQEFKVGSRASMDIVLKPEATSSLDEVVVTSLGIKKQARSLGYAVSTVTAKDLTESGNTNFASALYGKAAGVKITTAPGGASSAVNVQIRGVSSLGLNTQPLYVLDGIPIRSYNDLSGPLSNKANNNGYYSDTRIEGNGVLDINPDDIESLTVLKGASAAALYGSEANNGVVVITTKKGTKSRGLGVDVNYNYDQERLQNSLDYQNEYGPGYDAQTNVANGIATFDGWSTQDSYHHPYWNSYAEFGPKFDGSTVRYWDGTMRPYVAQPNNYRDFFQVGYNSSANVAVSNAGDKGSFRFSYNRFDYKGIVPGSDLNKNNFNFNGTLKLNDRVSVDLVSTYNYNFTHNRPVLMNQIFGSYGGFFSRADDMKTFFNKYQTPDGYKYVSHSTQGYDQNLQFPYSFRATQLMDYLWTALRDSYDETQNRFINSVTLNVAIAKNWKFRGRVGGDMTNLFTEDKQHNTKPVYVGPSGQYDITSSTYNIFYGDALLTYSPKITNDLSLSISAGGTGRKQVNRIETSSTNTGLQEEDFFNINNSVGTATTGYSYYRESDVAAFGILDINYKNWLYLEGTGRYEGSSTLPQGKDTYFYPSVNGGFVFSDLWKMPSWVDYAKLRASYAIVGNHPGLYQANVGYYQPALPYNNSNILYQYVVSSSFGNEAIESERKREAEIGLETHIVHDRIGLDLSYYNNRLDRQIILLNTPTSTGASSVLANAGDLSNYGVEAAITATPLITRNFRWNARFNFAINRNKLIDLPNGLKELVLSSQDGGYLNISAKPGDALGNIYVHPKAVDAKGNPIIDDNGWYTVNTNGYQYEGNIMPKIIGGFSNSFSYKSFTLDLMVDYRFGGKLVSIPTYYMKGAGMFKSTLKYRDAAHGGIAYDAVDDASNNYVANPNGSRHDGVIIPGVTETGAVNTKVIPAAEYYENTMDWETNGLYENAVYDNSYIKMREATLTYTFPKSISSKLLCQNLQLSVFGRNLFYFYKTLPDGLDPEVPVGSSWLAQGIDGGSTAPTRSIGVSLRAKF
ncbi:MAG TPA: SusC/RagA family TonB-linked outer membrane protein [Puia sp.]|nr:SusC/RagA family TonB-linked outer membrane protein [Puia sp.]